MNKKLIVLGAASMAAAAINAQAEVSATTTFAWESSYVFRGVQFAEETYMPGLDLAFGDFYVGIWAAMPAGMEANEVDFYAGYGFYVSDTTSLDFGVTHYPFPDSGADIFDDGATTEIYAGVAFEVPFSPSAYVYYDFDLEALTLEGSVGHSFAMGESASFDLSGAVGYVSADGGTDYSYALVSAGFGFALNDYASASIYTNYSLSSEDYMYDGDSGEFWFGFSVTGGF